MPEWNGHGWDLSDADAAEVLAASTDDQQNWRLPSKSEVCPDGGACHHGCWAADSGCWRVHMAGPLTGVYPGDVWPADVQEQHLAYNGLRDAAPDDPSNQLGMLPASHADRGGVRFGREPADESGFTLHQFVQVWTGHEWKDGRLYGPEEHDGVPGYQVCVFGDPGTRFFMGVQIRHPLRGNPQPEPEPAVDPYDDQDSLRTGGSSALVKQALEAAAPDRTVVITPGPDHDHMVQAEVGGEVAGDPSFDDRPTAALFQSAPGVRVPKSETYRILNNLTRTVLGMPSLEDEARNKRVEAVSLILMAVGLAAATRTPEESKTVNARVIEAFLQIDVTEAELREAVAIVAAL